MVQTNEQYLKSGYNITTNPQFQNKRFGITPELDRQLGSLALECQNANNKKMIDKLTKLIIQYPTVPLLKNFLSVAYSAQGNKEKAIEVNNWLLSEHPDYLFAKINQANDFIDKGEFERVPEILGEAVEIKQLYPERDLFHLSEVTAFYRIAIRYFASIGDLGLAENRLEILRDIAPDHTDTERSEFFLAPLRLQKGMERRESENKQRISPKVNKSEPLSDNNAPPQFNHDEIQHLYHYGLAIPHEILREIIALPRTSLIADLESILSDAINRYSWFSKMDYEEEKQSFVLHALFLLKEINSVESLPKIFSFLGYNDDIVEFWLGDHQTATLWQCIYGLGLDNTKLLRDFLIQPGIDTFCKTAVSETLCQMALHCPEKREEVLQIYSDVLKIFSEASDEENLIDSEFLGLAIADIIDCNMPELLPVIKTLYDQRYVALGICGDYDKVEKAFGKISSFNHKRDLYDIFDLYHSVLSTWDGYIQDRKVNHSTAGSNYQNPFPHQQAVSEKIGRNEPCPCGSGKKYKKCCMK